MNSMVDRPLKSFSCIRCFEKKVKCDKQNPCSNCAKYNVKCVFRVPPAPRRRKKRPEEDAVSARLKICEDLLRSKGVDIDSLPTQSDSSTIQSGTIYSTSQSGPETSSKSNQTERDQNQDGHASRGPQYLFDHGKSRSVEISLWRGLADEFQSKEAMSEQCSEDDNDADSPIEGNMDFLFGSIPSGHTIQQLHPLPDQITILWQAFWDNVNPITKFIHQPTFQETLLTASSCLDSLPKGLEALMFSIYGAAVFSMHDEECSMKLGEPRKTLLVRYRNATRKALGRAKFMGTADIQVLQALVLYLLTMREEYDPRTIWTFIGVACRIAQGMGLHRDGTTLGLSPFETEMRRRLWCQISILDLRLAVLSGRDGLGGDFNIADTQAPSNVDDAELYPGMETAPVSHLKPTEMVVSLLCRELGLFWTEKLNQKSNVAFENLRLASPWVTTPEERDAHINELEQRIEDKYLRYCDPSVSSQFLCIVFGRASINSIRLLSHHPRQYANPEKEMLSAEQEDLWKAAVNLLESDNLQHASKGLRRFLWYTNVYFPWQALIYLLNELRKHTLGDKVDKAWEQVNEIFLHHPNFTTGKRKPLHVAVGSLCLKAYNAREAAIRGKADGPGVPQVVPEYIKLLRDQRQRASSSIPNLLPSKQCDSSKATASSNQTRHESQELLPSQQNSRSQLPLPTFSPASQLSSQMPSDQNMFASDPMLAQDLAMDDTPIDWAQWDHIMEGFELGR